jgi:dipeptidyl aminopeptidase/acylaminoacyl peptidase
MLKSFAMIVMVCFMTNVNAAPLREHLFSNPSLMSAKISPDKSTLAIVGADSADVPNVYLAPKDDLDKKTQVTFFSEPEIIQFFWSGDSKRILLLKDQNGTGQLHLHGVDIRSKKERIYTEKWPSINAKVIQIGRHNKAVIGLNHRNPHFHDLYVLDLDSGEFTLLLENNSYAKFLLSPSLDVILKMKINDDGCWTVFKDDDTVFLQLNPKEAFHTEFLSYDEKAKVVYMLDNRAANTTQLISKSLEGIEVVLGAQNFSDVDDVLFVGGVPKAYASYYTQKKWYGIDREIEKDLVFLEKHVGGNFEVVNQSSDDDIWLLSNSVPDRGSDFWIYGRTIGKLTSLQTSSQDSQYAKMYEMIVEARDGQKLICYYTLPKEHDKGGYVERPIPLVVYPHGGPFKCRNKFEFNAHHQWLAQCGYAVLSVNFRLSSGFGKDFVNAGNGEWGGKAHLDVIDAVEACIAKGITEKGKLAIVGASYGGYETLASLTFTPDYFTCCVAICGPSNLKTVLGCVPKFWEFTVKPLSDKTMFFTKSAFITSMGGNPEDPIGSEYLEKCSPLNHLDKIKAPLLLVHGANDHVVVEKESRQIYESMKKNGKPVTYLLFPDEGHRFAKFANKMVYHYHAEFFLSQHLKGKYQPLETATKESSSVVMFN